MNQRLALLRDLVTLGPYANTRDGVTATHGLARHGSDHGNSFDSRVQPASEPGWRLCWPLCRQGPSSNVDADDYADRDEITSGSPCIYGALPGPWRPPLRGAIIDPTRRPFADLDVVPNSHVPRHRSLCSTAPGPDWEGRFAPLVLGQIQPAADTEWSYHRICNRLSRLQFASAQKRGFRWGCA